MKHRAYVTGNTQTIDLLTIILDLLSLIAFIIAFYFLYKLFTKIIRSPRKPF